MRDRMYPYYGRHSSGLIVEFTARETGTVICTGTLFLSKRVGQHKTTWNESAFKRITSRHPEIFHLLCDPRYGTINDFINGATP